MVPPVPRDQGLSDCTLLSIPRDPSIACAAVWVRGCKLSRLRLRRARGMRKSGLKLWGCVIEVKKSGLKLRGCVIEVKKSLSTFIDLLHCYIYIQSPVEPWLAFDLFFLTVAHPSCSGCSRRTSHFLY